jgi:hypothetical protein
MHMLLAKIDFLIFGSRSVKPPPVMAPRTSRIPIADP